MKIITVCGSFKFKQEMAEVAECLTLEGNCVLTPNELVRQNKEAYTQEEVILIDKMHKEQLRLSDAIVVVNVNDYIGNSTALKLSMLEY